MPIKTRKPTAKPSWPVLLLAGAEKAGKSYSCALASSSEKIGRTLWVSVGETDPDQYAAIPGADFEIVEHDGTVQGILNVLVDIASEPAGDKPTLLVVDSMTRLWEMVTDSLQTTATSRAKKYGKGGDAPITMDLWNRGKGMWKHLIQAINAHNGPVLLTARLEPVTVMDDRGKPTPIKADKIKTEKSLPYDVDGVIQMPERGKTTISGLRSVVVKLDGPTDYPNFTVDGLWTSLGLGDTGERRVSEPAEPETLDVEAS